MNDEVLLGHCQRERCRASGPGGQHVQKNACGIRLSLRHKDRDTVVQCQDLRSLEANTSRALRELRIRLALQERGFASEDCLSRFRQGRSLKISSDNALYYRVVAYFFDVLEDIDFDLPQCAETTGLSSSQIIKCLRQHKLVWQTLQTEREQRGLAKLK